MLNSGDLNSDTLNEGTLPTSASATFARLYPLRESFEESDIEGQIKALFIRVYETLMMPNADDLNLYGMAHLGSFELMERFVRADGLALVRNNDDTAMRHLYRAWKSRYRARGLKFLKLYLQLLWPNQWEAYQMWQEEAEPYPTSLIPAEVSAQSLPGYYLTSRVHVGIEDEAETPEGVARVVPALRAVISAKFVLDVTALRRSQDELRIAPVACGVLVSIETLDCSPATSSGLRFAGAVCGALVSLETLDCAAS